MKITCMKMKLATGNFLLLILRKIPRPNSDNAACVNATMDISVATELFRNLITGCRTLGMEEENVEKWQKILDKMPPYLINEDGALKEWADFGLEDNYDHRHSSHLYLFYYDIPRKETPEILEAAKKAYEIKMERRKKSREPWLSAWYRQAWLLPT